MSPTIDYRRKVPLRRCRMEPDTGARDAFTFPRLNAAYVANDTEPS
jgi:hypothetical protein